MWPDVEGWQTRHPGNFFSRRRLMGDRRPYKADVAGSTPAASTVFFLGAWPNGKALALQASFRRFNSCRVHYCCDGSVGRAHPRYG